MYFLLNLFSITECLTNHLILFIMNKSELIDAIAADAGITKAAAKSALESFLGNVGATLKKGGRVSLVGFGSWSVSKRAARDGRNPQTGKTIKIAAKNVVKFKAGADLEGSVN
jgi:DNA-binding protein HU-beta